MDVESTILSEISTTWFHLYVESDEQNKLTNKIETDL